MSRTGQLSYRLASSNARSRSAGMSALLIDSSSSFADAASAAAPSQRPRRMPVSRAFDVSSQTRAGATTSAPATASSRTSNSAAPRGGVSGATRSTTTLASTTGMPVLDDQIGCASAGLRRQACLPLGYLVEPRKQTGIGRGSVRVNARLQLQYDLLQVHHV